MKILLAGGGSGGPVAPLLAVAAEIKKTEPKARFLLVGTNSGPEAQMAKDAGVDFVSIPAGKWRRYFSLRNFAAPFFTLAGLAKAFGILKRFKPDCVFGAGSFVQVPIIWAAWILRIPCVVHQQDVEPSLANRLCAPFAQNITVCFEKSLTDFPSGLGLFYKSKPKQKVLLTGNPFREELKDAVKEKAIKALKLRRDMPVLLALGGGTGADYINNLIIKSLPSLAQVVQVIHSTGSRGAKAQAGENYHPYAFISDMGQAYAAADIVLSRAGLSTLTELSNLGKVSIIIPMPDTHQEYNAFLLEELKAALVFGQKELNPEVFTALVRKILFNLPIQKALSKNISGIMPKDSAAKISKIIKGAIKNANE